MPMLTRGVHLIAVDPAGSGDGFADLGRQRFDIGYSVDVFLQHGEFVAAEAGDHVGLAHAALEPSAIDLQQLVADRMAQRVVDVLEVIEIEIMHGELIVAALGAGEFELAAVREMPRGSEGRSGSRCEPALQFSRAAQLALGDVGEDAFDGD